MSQSQTASRRFGQSILKFAFSSRSSFRAVLLAVFVFALVAFDVRAATFVVTTDQDPDNTTGNCLTNGACSLRQAVNSANA